MAAHGQVANNTSLVGTVTDASGAVLAGAQVVAVNRDTKVEYPGKTNAEGYYAIPFVIPGTYDVTVEAPGFKKVTVDRRGGHAEPRGPHRPFCLPSAPRASTVTVSAATRRPFRPTMPSSVKPSRRSRSRTCR